MRGISLSVLVGGIGDLLEFSFVFVFVCFVLFVCLFVFEVIAFRPELTSPRLSEMKTNVVVVLYVCCSSLCYTNVSTATVSKNRICLHKLSPT